MIMPIQLLKLSAVNKEGSESVLIHCLFYIAMRSEEAAGGRLCRSISHKSILPNLLYERDVTSTIIPPMINNVNAIYINPPTTIPIRITGKNTTEQSSLKIPQEAFTPNINNFHINPIMHIANINDNIFFLLTNA